MQEHNDITNSVDEPETIAALAALEGRGTLSSASLGSLDEDLVAEFEAAAGAVLVAFGRGSAAPAPPAGLDDRLESLLLAKIAAAASAESTAGAPHTTNGSADAARGAAAPSAAVQPQSPHGAAGRIDSSTADVNRSGSTLRAPSYADAALTGSAGGGRLLRFGAILGWAAAAALLGMLVLSKNDGAPGDPRALDVLTARLEEASDTEHIPWQTDDAGSVGGEVVWSDALNDGYMRIRGLEANDPGKSQYQLWIFRGSDPSAEDHPIDGGVFDVPANGEVLVPIDAKLGVGHAGFFAVTVEKPGGVVVSGRESIVLAAPRAS